MKKRIQLESPLPQRAELKRLAHVFKGLESVSKVFEIKGT
jgi:hypothetical protein